MSATATTISVPRRVIRFTDRAVDKGLSILFLILLALGAYFAYDSWYVFNAASLDHIPGYTWEGPGTLATLSEDAIAWLTVDDTKIDCPIMQGKTNNEYLNKNPYGEYSLAGSVFLDAANAPDFSDPYSLLYGHHMAQGFMFGTLDEFLKDGYLDKHRTGTLTIRHSDNVGERIPINLFAVMETDASETTVFDITAKADVAPFIEANAKIYRKPELGSRIIALSTCKSPLSTERLVIFATRADKGTITERLEASKAEQYAVDGSSATHAASEESGSRAHREQGGEKSVFEALAEWFSSLFGGTT